MTIERQINRFRHWVVAAATVAAAAAVAAAGGYNRMHIPTHYTMTWFAANNIMQLWSKVTHCICIQQSIRLECEYSTRKLHLFCSCTFDLTLLPPPYQISTSDSDGFFRAKISCHPLEISLKIHMLRIVVKMTIAMAFPCFSLYRTVLCYYGRNHWQFEHHFIIKMIFIGIRMVFSNFSAPFSNIHPFICQFLLIFGYHRKKLQLIE